MKKIGLQIGDKIHELTEEELLLVLYRQGLVEEDGDGYVLKKDAKLILEEKK